MQSNVLLFHEEALRRNLKKIRKLRGEQELLSELKSAKMINESFLRYFTFYRAFDSSLDQIISLELEDKTKAFLVYRTETVIKSKELISEPLIKLVQMICPVEILRDGLGWSVFYEELLPLSADGMNDEI